MTDSKIIQKGIKAALKLASTTPWNDLTLSAIAKKAGLTLQDFHGVATRDSLSYGVEAYFDQAMSEGSLSDDEAPRTRIFDVIMMRFEAMEDVRDGALSFLRWRDRSLAGLAARVRARAATAKWALACAGLDRETSLPGALHTANLAVAIASAERAWRKETSPDLTRTMAALDAALIKALERTNMIKRATGRKPDAAGEPAA